MAGWQARAERAEAQLVACRREYDELWATERERDLAVRDLAVKLERAREALERIAQVWPEGGYAATWMRDTASEALSRLDGPEKLAPTNRGEQQ